MKKLYSLTRTLLKNDNIFTLSDAADKKKLVKSIILMLILVLSFLPMAFGFGFIAAGLYTSLSSINQEGIILVLGFSVVSMVIFVFGIFYIMSVFYFSTDILYLLPLPLKPYQIISAKFITVLIYEYITETLFFLPIVLVYGVKSSAGPLFYLYGLIIFLMLPIFPLAAASLIDMVVMRFSHGIRNKDMFKTIAGISAMFIAIAFSTVMNRFQQSVISPEKLQSLLLQGNNSLISTVSSIFITSKYAGLCMADSGNVTGLLFIVIFILINIAVFALLIMLGQGLYLKGAVGLSEASSRRKKLGDERLNSLLVRNSALKSYLLKEIRLLFRTPVYFINCVMMNFLWPVFIMIPILAQKGLKTQLSGFSVILHNPKYFGIIVAVASAGMIVITSFNSVAATSISRDGSNFYINKYIPVSYKTQIIAKVLSGVVLSVSGMLFTLAVLGFLFGLSLSLVLIIIIPSIAGIIFSCFAGILVDLSFPKLVWVSEQKAVKQNLNGLLSTLFCGAVGAGAAYAVIKSSAELLTASVAITLLYLILDTLLYYMISTYGVRRFSRIVS